MSPVSLLPSTFLATPRSSFGKSIQHNVGSKRIMLRNYKFGRAWGHHIQTWLNGVQIIDTIHAAGFEEGAIGFQLCNRDKHAIVEVKSLYIKRDKLNFF